MAAKKLDLPLPFRPIITLCFGLKGSISDWCRKDRKPDKTTCLMCMVEAASKEGERTGREGGQQ